MIVKIENYKSYANLNIDFHDENRTIIGKIFETDSLGKIGYKLSTLTSFNNVGIRYAKQSDNKTKTNITLNYKKVKFYQKYDELGPLEASFIKYVLGSDYNVIVLTGALGSGKTSLSSYCLDLIEKSKGKDRYVPYINKFPRHGKIIRIDFNEAFYDQKTKYLLIDFTQILIDRLSGALTELLTEINYIDGFIEHIEENFKGTTWESSFRSFLNKWHLTYCNIAKDEDDKLRYLLNWITENEHTRPSFKLRLITYIFKFLKGNFFNSNTTDFIILFDNIDKFPDDAQVIILDMIFSLYYKSNMKVVLPLRLTTFGRIKGNGSYSFGVFPNRNNPPINIIKHRINHFINNQKEYSPFSDSEDVNLIKSKLIVVSGYLKYREDRLTKAINSFSGNSIRRGLFLSERLLMNSTIPYNEINSKQDRLIRSLMVGANNDGFISNNDGLISNILISTDTGQNSLICIRILQILNYFVQNKLYECHLQIILSQLDALGNWDRSSILHSINYLLEYRKRLIYIEGVRSYSDINNLYQSGNDKVYITISGHSYLNDLLYDLEYLQSCFLKTNWSISKDYFNPDYFLPFIENSIDEIKTRTGTIKNSSLEILTYIKSLLQLDKFRISDHISPGFNNLITSERIKLVRDGLFIFFLNDLGQISMYHDYDLDDIETSSNKYISDLKFANIFGKVSIAAIKILSNHIEDEKEEILNWYSQLIVISIIYKIMFKKTNLEIEKSIKMYKAKIKYNHLIKE